jgi:hypothetical protein
MKPEKDNTFCYYPFFQLALKKWSSKGIETAAPCCNSIRPENDNPLNLNSKLHEMTHEEIFRSPVMNDLRQSMIKGERHPACTTCWKMEDKGIVSYRLHSGADYEITQSHIETPKLTCIDFSFGDNCNLRCRMCQPGLSNKLRIDYKHFFFNNLDTNDIQGFELISDDKDAWIKKNSEHDVLYWPNDSWQWKTILYNIKNLTQLKAAGGETTITKPFIEFIDKAIEVDHAKNVSLNFHTNATKFNDDLLEKLVKFKALDLNFSIDSYGKNYEYIRYPMTWKALDKSIRNFFDKVKDNNINVSVQFTNVLSCLNAFNIHEIYNYWLDIKREYQDYVSLNFWVDFIWPQDKHISVKFLSKDLKLELIDYYKNLFGGHVYPIQHIIKFLENHVELPITDSHRKNMLREISLFDKSRNQSYKDYLDYRIINFLETEIK